MSDRLSDIVGRSELRYRDFVSIVARYRIDKDDFALRRNEVDATIGSRSTYILLGYLRLNRNIDPIYEDLADHEEVRVGGAGPVLPLLVGVRIGGGRSDQQGRGPAVHRGRVPADPPPAGRAI